jgi:hypothetical protein
MLTIATSQSPSGSGTLEFSWSTYYPPKDLSVSFSPQNPVLPNSTASVQVQLSSSVPTGNYTLGIGIDAGAVLVWQMVPVEVAVAQPSIVPNVNPLILVMVVVIAIGLDATFYWSRSRRDQYS